MVAHSTMRTQGLNQAFRFVEGIWLHQIRFFLQKIPVLLDTCATCSELPSYTSTMIRHTISEIKTAQDYLNLAFLSELGGRKKC